MGSVVVDSIFGFMHLVLFPLHTRTPFLIPGGLLGRLQRCRSGRELQKDAVTDVGAEVGGGALVGAAT